MYREDRETVTCSKKSCHPSGCQNIVPQTPLKGPRGKESILHEAASAGSTHPKRGGGSPPLPTSGRRSKQSPGYHSEGCPGKSRLSSRAQPWQGGAEEDAPSRSAARGPATGACRENERPRPRSQPAVEHNEQACPMMQGDVFLPLLSHQFPPPEELPDMPGDCEPEGRAVGRPGIEIRPTRPWAHVPRVQPGHLCPLTGQATERTTPAVTGVKDPV